VTRATGVTGAPSAGHGIGRLLIVVVIVVVVADVVVVVVVAARVGR
jgi:hypothetical protein